MQYINWFPVVRRCTEHLVRIRSVSPSPGETDAAREVVRLLGEDGLAGAYNEIGLDPLLDDPWQRENAYAFLRGTSARTVVLLGHLDTVDTADYGPLEPLALDPEALAAREEELAALPGVADDLAHHPGDWMFGRGAADMKSGVAATIAVLRRLAEEGEPPISVVLLATVDEENESAGVLRAIEFLDELRRRHGLEYVGAINTDYTSAQGPEDRNRYIDGGTIGKLLPGLFVVGAAAHAGEPFKGVDANLLTAELIRDLSMNPELVDVVSDARTPPPVTLRATDLKLHYDTQLPLAAYVLLNVLTLTTDPATLLARLRNRAQVSLDAALDRIAAAEQRLGGTRKETGEPRRGTVLTYEELYAESTERLDRERVGEELAATWDQLPAGLDKRERCVRLIERLWALSGLQGPAVMLFYAPPYYPHVAPSPSALQDALDRVVADHPELPLVRRAYFPLLSDLSYLRLDDESGLDALIRNMPVWSDRPDGYSLPFDLMRRLDVPIVNIGPYGRGAHQASEAVLMSYSFGVVPQLLYETIQQLASWVGGGRG